MLSSRNILILILGCSFLSCNPFISKDLRRKNRCNRKLERVIRKCPELTLTDTFTREVMIPVPKVEIDTFIEIEPDTMWLREIKNDTVREFVRQKIFETFPFDTVIHQIDGFTFTFYGDGYGNIHYTVDKPAEELKTTIEEPIQVVRPVQLTIWEQIMNKIGRFWWWLVIAFALYILYRKIIK